MKNKPIVIVGAGPTGLSAAYHAGEDALLLEREARVGGWCRSFERGGFTFDMAGHIMFSNDPYVHELYGKLLGDNVHWQDREAWIYSKDVFTRYPFQGSLYGLPPEVIRECVMGAIEARYGTAAAESMVKALEGNGSNGQLNGNGHANGKGHANGNGHASGQAVCEPGVSDCCADGILEAEVPLSATARSRFDDPTLENFEDFIYRVWGKGIARHFAVPYNRKLWAVPLEEMETSWLGGRVPLPDLEQMIEGALTPAPKPMGPNARFGYPLRGGFQALMDGFLPHLRAEVRLGTEVSRISARAHTLTLRNGAVVPYDVLVSTMPLPQLVRSLGPEAPAEAREAAEGLRHVSVRCVNLGVGREHLTDKHWIYYPEDTVFHRIFVQGNASPHCNPPGGFGLTCEITYSPHKPLPAEGDALIRRCIEDCRRVGLLREDDPVPVAFETDLPVAYVVYDHGRKARVDYLRQWLRERDIVLAGRYSEWEYYNSDHAFLAGRKAVEAARALQEKRTRAPISATLPRAAARETQAIPASRRGMVGGRAD